MIETKTNTVDISIIIAAWNDIELLQDCLSSLEAQTGPTTFEVIVAHNFAVPQTGLFSDFTFVELPGSATVPELRRAGLTAANGRIAAFAEDHCTFHASWCENILRSYSGEKIAVGGPIENASPPTALNWAVYFYDYGRYMPPMPAGRIENLSGMNVSYPREVLDGLRAVWHDGFFEASVNPEVVSHGYDLIIQPDAIVYHCKNYQLGRALSHSFHLARSYAARRVSGSQPAMRFFRAFLAITLPVILPLRVISSVLGKRRHVAELFLSLPHLVVLLFVWSCGEFCGYLFGEGESAKAWR